MSLSDTRLIKGLLFGILGHLATGPLWGVALNVVAIVYVAASIFTKEPRHDR